MIHYFYGTLQVGIGQTLCSFEHVSCLLKSYCLSLWAFVRMDLVLAKFEIRSFSRSRSLFSVIFLRSVMPSLKLKK